jgi:hypothetical protein
MRNVFLFIRRYFNLLFFLLLQVAALTLLFRYNKFHQAAIMDVANEVTGRVNVRYNNVESYFSLKKDNEKLREQNARLLNMLKGDFDWPDSALNIITDTIRIDSLEQYRKYLYLPAKVISTTVNEQNNYLMLHRGSNQGVGVNMEAAVQGFLPAEGGGGGGSAFLTARPKQLSEKAQLAAAQARLALLWEQPAGPLAAQQVLLPQSLPGARAQARSFDFLTGSNAHETKDVSSC